MTPGSPSDRGLAAIVVASALGIVAAARLSRPEVYALVVDAPGRLGPGVWWAITVGVCFGVPAVAVAYGFGERLGALGLGVGNLRRDAWMYAVAWLVLLPGAVLASTGAEARARYPLCVGARDSFPDLGAWLAAYLVMYVGLEALFRGALLFPLARRMGSLSLVFGVIPYVMVHLLWDKGLAETVLSIPYALAVGALVLRTRSIWGAVALHFGLAATVDLAILAGDGTLVRLWEGA